MTTGIKLAIGGVIVAGATIYMAYVGAASSWQYYVTVDECLSDAASLAGDRIRVTGRLAPGSLRTPGAGLSESDSMGTQATFQLAGADGRLSVICRGPLPDNLKEDIDVVVEGRLNDSGVLQGDRVLTRCASKYESRQPPSTASAGTAPRVVRRPRDSEIPR